MEPTHDKKVNLLHQSAKEDRRKTQTQKGADVRPGRAPKKTQKQPKQTVEAPRPEIIDFAMFLNEKIMSSRGMLKIRESSTGATKAGNHRFL